MPFSPQLPVLIVGAGTGSLALAHGLRRAGVPVRVYERDRTRTGGLQGYRVGISPNGVRALRDCLPPELFETFVATTARDYAGFNMFTERFAPLVSITSDHLLAPDGVRRSRLHRRFPGQRERADRRGRGELPDPQAVPAAGHPVRDRADRDRWLASAHRRAA